MPSLTSSLLELPSKVLCSGSKIFQLVEDDRNREVNKLDLSLAPSIEVGSQFVYIDHSKLWQVHPFLEEDLRSIPVRVNIHSPISIHAQLGGEEDERKWTMNTNTDICSLGNWLIRLGTSYLDFKYWDTLTIELPIRMELPFDPDGPVLPIEKMARLRHLIWRGHPAQLGASFLPFSPLLLQNLETLTIESDLTLNDCIHILRESIHLKKLNLRTIRHSSAIDPFVPSIQSPPDRSILQSPPNRRILSRLVDLELRSDVDISLVLKHFHFPSLTKLFLGLKYTSRSDLENSKSFHWEGLKEVVIYSDLSDEGKDRIRSHCVNAQSLDLDHSIHPWYYAGWYHKLRQQMT
ncbi:hypothetical protein H0H93_004614 [Arthromyces matolae]|nr:hypothetical protein H0H93_004614 [Arthromyces matolae]